MAVVSSKRAPKQHAERRAAREAAEAAAAAEAERRAEANPETFAEWSALLGTDPYGMDGEAISEQRRVLVTRSQSGPKWASEVRTDDNAPTKAEALSAAAADLLGTQRHGRVPAKALRGMASCVITSAGNMATMTNHDSGICASVDASFWTGVRASDFVAEFEALGLPVPIINRVGDARPTWAEAKALAGSARDARTLDAKRIVAGRPYVTQRVTAATGERVATEERKAERRESEQAARTAEAARTALLEATADTSWPQPKKGRPSLAVTLWRDLLAAADGDRAAALAALATMVG